MTPLDGLTAGTAVFIVGMVWLRTRMHYPRGRERLSLTRAGRIYFAVLLGVLVLGWLVAPTAEHPHARARRVVPRHLLPLHPVASGVEGAEGRGIQSLSDRAAGCLWQQRHVRV
jgi:hypothetical protein